MNQIQERASFRDKINEDEVDDESFQRHMSVLDETIGSQRVDDEELVVGGDEKSSYATHITNSNVFLTKQGTTETKKNRRVAQ